MASSFTVGPRVEFDLDGYVRLRVWDAEAGRDRYIYLHRLVAFATGEIDSLAAEEHAHHLNGDRWDNRHENIEARGPAAHANHHLNGRRSA